MHIPKTKRIRLKMSYKEGGLLEVKVQKLIPFLIAYEKELYVWTTKESQVGDIALCLKKTSWTTEGKYYRLVECYPPDGFKGIIADDGEPMGIHDCLGGFIFYRKIN